MQSVHSIMVTTHNGENAARFFTSLPERIGAMLRRFGDLSQGAQCAREATRLSQMSDDELAKRGLKRADIVRHAFRNHLYS